MSDSVAILSGGIDSVTMLHHLVKVENRHPALLTFAYGQKHSKEIEFARAQAELLGCQDHTVLDLAFLQLLFKSSALVSNALTIPSVEEVMGDPQPLTYVPNRNMIFLALAAAYAESMAVSEVFYGAQSHDMYGYWDTTPDFLERLNDVYELNRNTAVQIKAPLIDCSKTDVLRMGLQLGVDYSQTWSCYAGEELACGRCPTCAERLQAFRNVGILDPILYQQ